MKLNLISKALVVALSAASLVACNSSDSDDSSTPVPSADLQFSFGLENTKEIANNNNIPMPNDLYFIDRDGEGETGIGNGGNLIIFGCGNKDVIGGRLESTVENNTKCALEDLQGWSTTAPFTLPMLGDVKQLDSTTFTNNIRIFQGASELVYGADFTVRTTKFNHLQILPLQPLNPKTKYTLVITNGLQSTSGLPVKAPTELTKLLDLNTVPENDYLLAMQTIANKLYENIAKNTVDISKENILYAAEITTQPIGSALVALANNPDLNSITSTNDVTYYPVKSDIAIKDRNVEKECVDNKCVRKLQSTIDSPYYLSNSQNIDAYNCIEDANNKENAKFWFNIDGIDVNNNESYFESYNYTASSCPDLFSSWEIGSNPMLPIQQDEKQKLDVQVILPHGMPEPVNGWPVVIFSHGITAAKEFGNGGMLVLDNFVQAEIANQGYAVIAIDHPLHNTRSINLYNEIGEEEEPRKYTTEINVSQSLRGLFPGHDKADVKNFLKADALLTSRDNLRQSIADLINLRASLKNNISFKDTDGVNVTETLNTSSVYVMGHSMGAIAASSFAGILENTVDLSLNGAILANPGAGIAGILMNSVWLGHSEVPPAIKALPEFRLRMASELGLNIKNEDGDVDEVETLAAVRTYAEQNPTGYKQKSDLVSPEFLSEYQYMMQTVVDTVDPLNYAEVLKNKPMLSFSVTGSITTDKPLQDIQGNLFTTADQTVPIKVELDGQTTYEVCNSASAVAEGVASQDLGCFNGSSHKPYYSLDNTEFPLSGATPLEEQLGLESVLNGNNRSYTRFLVGTHNIGAGTLTGSETDGNADYDSVKSAATELALQAVSFVKDNTHTVTNPNESIIESAANK